jgi:hypothetical protein
MFSISALLSRDKFVEANPIENGIQAKESFPVPPRANSGDVG